LWSGRICVGADRQTDQQTDRRVRVCVCEPYGRQIDATVSHLSGLVSLTRKALNGSVSQSGRRAERSRYQMCPLPWVCRPETNTHTHTHTFTYTHEHTTHELESET